MPRNENPIDPNGGPVATFAQQLRDLREGAGKPSYRCMAYHVFYCPSVLSQAAAGRNMPTWKATSAFVKACGGDQEQWRRRWEAAAGPPGKPAASD
jgi:hypothetical protein